MAGPVADPDIRVHLKILQRRAHESFRTRRAMDADGFIAAEVVLHGEQRDQAVRVVVVQMRDEHMIDRDRCSVEIRNADTTAVRQFSRMRRFEEICGFHQ